MANKPIARMCGNMVVRNPIFTDDSGEICNATRVTAHPQRPVFCRQKKRWIGKRAVDGNKPKAQELCKNCEYFDDMSLCIDCKHNFVDLVDFKQDITPCKTCNYEKVKVPF